MTYQRGETAILTTVTTTAAGTATTPGTSFEVRIEDPQGTRMTLDDPTVNGTMVEDSTGNHHYDHDIASDAVLGTYQVEFIATHSSRVSIVTDTFIVEVRPA